MDSDLLVVPSQKRFSTSEWIDAVNSKPEVRIHTHLVAEDNQRVSTGESVELLNTLYGRMLVPMTDLYMGSWLKNLGIYAEDVNIKMVQELLDERPKGTVVDVGANLGCWSLSLANSASKVLAIEPQRAIYNMLCGSVALNGLNRRVIPIHCALGKARGTAPILAIDPESANNFGSASLLQVTEDIDPRYTELVDVFPLWNLINIDEHVSFIKIDVEGFEEQVLLGALEVIARCRPIMFIEWFLSRELELGLQIKAMGYHIEYIAHNWICLPL